MKTASFCLQNENRVTEKRMTQGKGEAPETDGWIDEEINGSDRQD